MPLRTSRLALSLALLPLLGGCAAVPDARAPATATMSDAAPLESSLLEAGDAALRAGSKEVALQAYLQAQQLAPTNADAAVRIALAYRQLGNLDEATNALERAVQLRPEDPQLLTEAGMSQFAARRWSAASDYLQRAVERGANAWPIFNALGICADMQGNYAVASGHYEKAISLQRSALLYNNQGYSLYMAQNYGAAAASFENALRIEPKNQLAWRNLSLVRMRQGELDEALKAALKGGEIPAALNDVGYVAMLDGKMDSAKFLLELAIQMTPDKHYARAEQNLQRLGASTRTTQ